VFEKALKLQNKHKKKTRFRLQEPCLKLVQDIEDGFRIAEFKPEHRYHEQLSDVSEDRTTRYSFQSSLRIFSGSGLVLLHFVSA